MQSGTTDSHLAVFGNVAIRRVFCSDCEGFSLVDKNNRKLCCDALDVTEPKRIKRVVTPEQSRKRPSLEHRKAVLAAQNDCCAYCDRAFGSTVAYKSKTTRLRPHWDHLVPYSFQQNNADDNFVAACHVCNSRKSSLIFQTMDEARVHLQNLIHERDLKALVN